MRSRRESLWLNSEQYSKQWWNWYNAWRWGLGRRAIVRQQWGLVQVAPGGEGGSARR